MSLYSDYILEHTHGFVHETEHGFITFVITEQKTCYISEIYVKPGFRESGVASDMADHVVMIAREKGCKTLLGSVIPSAKKSTASLKVLLAYGFRLDSSTNDYILFKKEIL